MAYFHFGFLCCKMPDTLAPSVSLHSRPIRISMSRYLKYKAAGKCPRCGARKPEPGKLYCEYCRVAAARIAKAWREKNAEYEKAERKARRDTYLKHGICPGCGKREVFHRYKLCEVCLHLHRERAIKAYHRKSKEPGFYEAKRARAKAIRDKRRTSGLCIDCGKYPIAPGYSCRCNRCMLRCRIRAEARMALKRRNAKERGLCAYCDTPALPGFRTCKKHHEFKAEIARRNNKMRTGKQLAAWAAFGKGIGVLQGLP